MGLGSLPTELILQISDNLNPLDSFCVALTSRKLASILLPRARIITLSYAADIDDKDLFLKTIEQDVDFNFVLSGRTILEEYILTQDDEYVLPLLDRGVGLVSPPGSICATVGVNLLHIAAASGCGDAVIKRLLVHGDEIDPFAADGEGTTPLVCAINKRRLAVVKTLVKLYQEKGREIDPPDSKCPLILEAMQRGFGEIVLFLLKTKGVRVNARGPSGENALHWLARTEMTPDDEDAWEDTEDEEGDPTAQEIIDMIEQGLRNGDPGFTETDEDINITVLNALIKAGVSFTDTATEDRVTPLHASAQRGRYTLVEGLVAAGADISVRCAHGGTPLHWAAKGGSVLSIDTLVDLGTSLHVTDLENKTPLLWAYECDNFDGPFSSFDPSPYPIDYLLQYGANLSHLDSSNQSALHMVAQYERPNGAIQLLAAGIDVDMQRNDGSTALHLAALNGSYSTAEQLLRARPNLELKNVQGQTALDVAIENGQDKVAKLIRSYVRRGVRAVGGPINERALTEMRIRLDSQSLVYEWID
ncbi:ankyrin repeat domain-containing protein [Nannizzia gypsea CBS 118893]|uniref:Ankyrin repeat domain-containing protein n=1 Tax=Arthroderma gypseum (strain ATCC MYA-4604 / CBS 118893) TaxID=535722 RepID=E4V327_ARTGP|nr:ankyrin repeat domain-containing protein [Nannizzia gypsea CBS 118893]EFR04401.1 ankyrin repeat domain-containing protein [Nannizzia gypsea CBS 118893]